MKVEPLFTQEMINNVMAKKPDLQPGEIVHFGCDLANGPDECHVLCWVERDGYIMIVNIS